MQLVPENIHNATAYTGGAVLGYFTGIPYLGSGVAVVGSRLAMGYGGFAGMLGAGVSALVKFGLESFNKKNNCSSCSVTK